MSLSNDDRAALLLAATVLTAHGRPGLADRLRGLALAPQEVAQQKPPPPQEPEQPRRHLKGRPPDDVSAVAMVVRQLGDDDVYSLFREAARVRPSRLTAQVWHRAEEAQSNT
jgi:hypothetical protein